MPKLTEKKKRIKEQQKLRKKQKREERVNLNKEKAESPTEFLKTTDLSSTEWLYLDIYTKNQIRSLLNNLDKRNIFLFEYKFSEALKGLIRCCERLYSPYVTKNIRLREVANVGLVNYYRGTFAYYKSESISYLPLELRLFIYVEMLKKEIGKYNIINIIRSIAVTLTKMNKAEERNISIFMLTWGEILLFSTTDYIPMEYDFLGYTTYKTANQLLFYKLEERNRSEIGDLFNLRREIIKAQNIAAIDALSEEFEYAYNAFVENNHKDLVATKMALELLEIYFHNIFPWVSEFKTEVEEYYRTGNKEKVCSLIDKKKNVKKNTEICRSFYRDDNIVDDLFSNYSSERMLYHHLWLGEKNIDVKIDELIGSIPDTISEEIYDYEMRRIMNEIYSMESFYKPDLEKLFMKIISAILFSQQWENLDYKAIIIDSIVFMNDFMWEKGIEGKSSQFKDFLRVSFEKTLFISKIKYAQNVGTGNAMAIFYAIDGMTIVHSDKITYRCVARRGVANCNNVSLKRIVENSIHEIIDSDGYIGEYSNYIAQNNFFVSRLSIMRQFDKDTIQKLENCWNDLESVSHDDGIRNIRIEKAIFEENRSASKGREIFEVKYDAPITQFEKDMESGIKNYRANRYVEACEAFLELLEIYKDKGMLYYYLACSFSMLKNGIDYSLRFFQKACELLDFVEVWVDYGDALRKLSRVDEAIVILEKAKKLYPEEGTPASILLKIYTEESLVKICKSEVSGKHMNEYDEAIHEWAGSFQMLKPHYEEW